jgi:hypothetical protein
MNETKQKKIKNIIDAMNIVIGEDVRKKDRTRDMVDARSICYKAMRDLKVKYKDIGEVFGRNHATAIHGIKSFKANYKYDPHLRDLYERFLEAYRVIKETDTDEHSALDYYRLLTKSQGFQTMRQVLNKYNENIAFKKKFDEFCKENEIKQINI